MYKKSCTNYVCTLSRGRFLKYGGKFRGPIAIWRRILEADFIWRRIPGADLHMEADFGGGLHMEADFGVNCIS
jgi:hypothetical protein